MFGCSRHCGVGSRRIFQTLNHQFPSVKEFPYSFSACNRRLFSNSEDFFVAGDTKIRRGWNCSGNVESPSYIHHKVESPLVEMTVGKLLETAAKEWPNRDCIVDSEAGKRLNYGQILRRADKVAAGLLSLGLKRGDRVALWGPNEIEWFVSLMAITRAGFIMVGINPAYQQDEVNYCLKKVDARAAISPRNFKTQKYGEMLTKAKESCPGLQHIVLYAEDRVAGTRNFADLESLASDRQVEAIAATQDLISPRDGCNIQFTSGTTGNPKATLISHRAFVNNSRQGACRLGLLNDHHKICLNVPFFHAFGMVMGQFSALHSGATIVIDPASFNPKKSIEAIMREKCTVAYGTPTMWINLLDARKKLQAPVTTLRHGVSGGSIISPAFMHKIRNELGCTGIQSIYGLTETTAIMFQSLPNETTEMTDNSVGHVSDHLEAKVVDLSGATVPMGTMGELWVRGYSTMMKYWDDPENTRKILTEDGWLKTGDQFVLRPDGYGQIVGRYKDIIIRGGENIFPKDVEQFLESHPEVREAHAFAVHDDVFGEEICACVRLDENSKLTKSELRAHGKGRVAHFKIPRHIEFVESFPRTTSGKVQKFKLRKDLEDRGLVPGRV